MADDKTRLGVERLEGWETFTVAGIALGLSRWAVHKMADRTDPDRPPVLKTARFIGDADRPVYLVRTEERKALGRERAREMAELAAKERIEAAEKAATG